MGSAAMTQALRSCRYGWAKVVHESPGLNGYYPLGPSFCTDEMGHAVDCHVLDTRSALTIGPRDVLLSSPGVYTFWVWNVIDNPACTYGACPDLISKTATVYASGTDINDCSAGAGEVGLANGFASTSDTDFTLPGLSPIQYRWARMNSWASCFPCS
jgi:hypothetical protein